MAFARTSSEELSSIRADENLLARLDRMPLTRSLWLILALLILSWLVESFDIGIVGTIVLMLKKLWHLAPAEVGLLGSSATAGIVLGLIPAGRLADLYGRRTVLVWGIVVFSVFTLAAVFAQNLWWLVVLRFLAGLGEGAVFPIPYLMISEFVNSRRRGAAIGWAELILTAGYTLPGLTGAWAVVTFTPDLGWRIPLLIGGAPILLVIPILLWVPESPRFLLKRMRRDEVRALVHRLEGEARIPHDETITNERALEILRATQQRNENVGALLKPPYPLRSFIAYSALAASFVLWYTMLTYAPTIFTAMGAKAVNGLIYTSVMMFVAGFGALVQGMLGDRYGRKPVHTAYMVLAAIGLGFLGQRLGLGVTVIAGFLAAFFGLGSFTLPKLYMAEQYPTKLRGLGSATGELITRFLCGVVLVYYIPTLLARFHPALLFIFVGIAMVVLVVPMALFGRETAGKSVEETGTEIHAVGEPDAVAVAAVPR